MILGVNSNETFTMLYASTSKFDMNDLSSCRYCSSSLMS